MRHAASDDGGGSRERSGRCRRRRRRRAARRTRGDAWKRQVRARAWHELGGRVVPYQKWRASRGLARPARPQKRETLYVAGDPRARTCSSLRVFRRPLGVRAARRAARCRARLPVGLSCLPSTSAPPRGGRRATTSTRWPRASRKASPRCARRDGAGGHELTVVVHHRASRPASCSRTPPAAPARRVRRASRARASAGQLYYALVHLNYQGMFAISFAPALRERAAAGSGPARAPARLRRARGWLNPVGPRTDARHGPRGPVGFLPWQAPDDACRRRRRDALPVLPVLSRAQERRALRALRAARQDELRREPARQPICFIFGEEKNTHFHNRARTSRSCAATAGCRRSACRAPVAEATSTNRAEARAAVSVLRERGRAVCRLCRYEST